MTDISVTLCNEITGIVDSVNDGKKPILADCWTTINGIPGMDIAYIDVPSDAKIIYQSRIEVIGRHETTVTNVYYISAGKWTPVQDAVVDDGVLSLDLEDMKTVRFSLNATGVTDRVR